MSDLQHRLHDLLFQVISRRYERKSLVLTTNLAFKEWPPVFPNATCATALIDRIIHHADVIAIEGQSYRLREAEERKATPPKPSPPTKPKKRWTHRPRARPACSHFRGFTRPPTQREDRALDHGSDRA